MTQNEIEMLAVRCEPLPKNTPPPETMLYYMLCGLYAAYNNHGLSMTDAQMHKKAVVNVYEQIKAEYEQFIEVCRLYQQRLKEGYSVGSVNIMKGDNKNV